MPEKFVENVVAAIDSKKPDNANGPILQANVRAK
jgi:hypothetical protein